VIRYKRSGEFAVLLAVGAVMLIVLAVLRYCGCLPET